MSSQWPQMAPARPGGVGVLWVRQSPGQPPLDLHRVWLLQMKAWIVRGCSSRSESSKYLGRTPAGLTKSLTNCLLKATGHPAGRGVRMGNRWLSASAGSPRQAAGGCRGGRGQEAAGVAGEPGVWARLRGQSRQEGRGQCMASFHVLQPHRPGGQKNCTLGLFTKTGARGGEKRRNRLGNKA